MKRTIIFIILIITCSILLIFLLKSNKTKKQGPNSFVREIKNLNLKLVKSYEFSDRSFRFSTKPNRNIKLNKYSDKLNLYELDYSFKKLDTIKIKFPSDFNSKAYNIYKDIFSSTIFCTNPYGDILTFNGKDSHFYKIRKFRFDFFQTISPTKIIVRGRYPHDKQNNRSIAKLTLSDTVIIDKEYVLPDLTNGLFANDGMMLYNNENSKILYMYYYRGEFLALDTNLKLLYKSKTIDTVQTVNIKTQLIQNTKLQTKSIIRSDPPKIINYFITTNKDKVYIISRLKADNESKSEFDKNQVIDIYDINNGKYMNSFYIPKFMGKRLNQFQIRDNMLFAIYGKYLLSYKIDNGN